MRIRILILFVVVCASAAASYGQFIGPGVFQTKNDPVSTDFSKAYASMKAGDFSSAEAPLKRVLAAEPKHISANYLMGVICKARQEYAAAIRYFTVAIEQREATPDPYSEAAEYYKARSDTYGYQGNFTSALKDATTGLRLNPEYAELYSSRAWFELYLQKNNEAYEDAIAALDLETDTTIDDRLAALIALRRMGKVDEIRNMLSGATSVGNSLQFLRGDITSAQLLQQTAAAPTVVQVYTRAIVGEVARINGDKKTAREHFEWVKANGNSTAPIVQLAIVGLTELGR
jgi:tetratricopeptide (TPR) repeat protein